MNRKRWQTKLVARFSLLDAKIKLDLNWLPLGFLMEWTMATAMYPSSYEKQTIDFNRDCPANIDVTSDMDTASILADMVTHNAKHRIWWWIKADWWGLFL